MDILVVILLTIIFILVIYLFLLRREIRRIGCCLDEVLSIDSNQMLHSEFSDKELNGLLQKINKLIVYVRNKELNLERKNSALKKEITNITHDLRTPLTSALGYIDLVLRQDLAKEEALKELKVIENRLLRLNELINSFFEFSMITTSTKPVEMELVNLVAIVEECISHYYDDFTQKSREIIFESKVSKCFIMANEEMLKRVIDNLIGNSLKHSNSNLIVKIYKSNDIRLVFENEVIDTNLDVEHIFDEFYTSDISRTKGNTGLGLAIAKTFVENLGGSIWAKRNRDRLRILIKFKS